MGVAPGGLRAPTDGPAVQATGLRKRYGDVLAVDGLDLEVARGTVVGFLGPNGAGKTTVVRVLSTLLSADEGSFTVAGVPHTRPAEIRARIGVLPESSGHPPWQTGQEWLTFHGELFGLSRGAARDRSRRLLADLGLAERAQTPIGSYSRGMRQRLGIARALLNDPQVVFLDEPTLGLDPLGQAQVLELVVRVARERGVTVLLSTHLLDEVEQTCDRVLVLRRGRLVAQGTVAEVVARAAAPREATLRVPPEQRARALSVLERTDGVTAQAGRETASIELVLPVGVPTEVATNRVLGSLLAADLPVLGLRLAGGRLSDAFLALTGDEQS